MSPSHESTFYDLKKLVSHRVCVKNFLAENTAQQIICDIDKTYLETKFETILGLARTVLEDAKNKKTVPGAKELLQYFRWGPASFSPGSADDENALGSADLKNSIYSADLKSPSDLWQMDARLQRKPKPLHFVSSSPPQLRQTIEEKLLRDGLDWTSDTLKDQIYNLKFRRFDLLKQQIAYKTLSILSLMMSYPTKSQWVFIGDNAESDPKIYFGIKSFVEGVLGIDAYAKYLEEASVEGAHIAMIIEVAKIYLEKKSAHSSAYLEAKTAHPSAQTWHDVAGIFIRKVSPDKKALSPGSEIFYFDHFLEASVELVRINFLDKACLQDLGRAFHNLYGFSKEQVLATLRMCP